MSKPVVFVIGASGNVGSSTLQALSAKYADRVEIRAGVRNPDKADKLKSISGVSVVKAEMGSSELENTLKGVHALFIVTPGAKNRTALTIATAESAKKAGVRHQLIVTSPSYGKKDTFLYGQMEQIETGVKGLGVSYTFLGLPLFYENYFGFRDTIKGAGAIYSPIDPTKKFPAVAVSDISNAAAAILADPTPHANKKYDIVSSSHTYNDVTAAFGEALGKSVTYNRIPYDVAKKTYLELGYEDWQVSGLIELFQLIDSGDPSCVPSNEDDCHKITGEQPTAIKDWVLQVKGAFQ